VNGDTTPSGFTNATHLEKYRSYGRSLPQPVRYRSICPAYVRWHTRGI